MREIIDDTYSLIKLTSPCTCGTTWAYPNVRDITYFPYCNKCNTEYRYICENDAKRYRLQPETIQLWNDIIEILSNYKEPIGVRQLFYQLVKYGWPKTERFSDKVGSVTSLMRKRGIIPFDAFSDSTRFYYKSKSYRDLSDALKHMQESYRKEIWFDLDFLVEVWIEKQGLINTVFSVTDQYDIPLMPSRGFPSISSLYDVAKKAEDTGKHIYIFYLGDYDPSGEMISETTEKTLIDFRPILLSKD